MKTRKLSGKVKILMLVFAGLVVGLCGVFGVLIVKTTNNQNEQVIVSSDCTAYDVNGNSIVLDDNATIYKSWNDVWMLKDTSKNVYTLGQNAVVYDQNVLKIFGGGYQIVSDSDVQVLDDYVEISSLTETGFFKLADRNYLAVGNQIGGEGEPVSTKGYLNFVLDKTGNALLLNNEVCEKTKEASAITIDDTFNFDIANEQLKLGDVLIDVGQIMGTSNEYNQDEDPTYLREKVEERLATGDNTTNPDEIVIDAHGGKGGTGGTGGTGADGGQGGAGGAGGPGGEGGVGVAPEVTDARMTMNIYSVSASYNRATVRYSVNDPYGQLGDVYFSLSKNTDNYTAKTNITCDIDGTEKTFYGLEPDTKYKLELYASTNSDTAAASEYFITLSPTATITVDSITEQAMVCHVYYESGLTFSSAKLVLYDVSYSNNPISSEVSIDSSAASSKEGYLVKFSVNLTSGVGKKLKVAFKDVKVMVNNEEKALTVDTCKYLTNPFAGLGLWRTFISDNTNTDSHNGVFDTSGNLLFYYTDSSTNATDSDKTAVLEAIADYKNYKENGNATNIYDGFTDWDANNVYDVLNSIKSLKGWS